MREWNDRTYAINHFLLLFTYSVLITVYFLAKGKNDLEIIFTPAKIQYEIYFSTAVIAQRERPQCDIAAEV